MTSCHLALLPFKSTKCEREEKQLFPLLGQKVPLGLVVCSLTYFVHQLKTIRCSSLIANERCLADNFENERVSRSINTMFTLCRQVYVLVHMIGDTLGKGKVERGGNPKVMIYQQVRSAAEMACGGKPVNMRVQGICTALGTPAFRREFHIPTATAAGRYDAGTVTDQPASVTAWRRTTHGCCTSGMKSRRQRVPTIPPPGALRLPGGCLRMDWLVDLL